MASLGPIGTADPDTPLYQVTFVVLDVETTGAAPGVAALTEIGAAVFQGGEQLGTFETLVDPGCAVPPFVSELTGITDAMVEVAPAPGLVVPAFADFVGCAVVVGHNVSFDLAFLDAALAQCHRPALSNPCVDTLELARRLVRDVVPDCALSTLARALHLEHRPAHRALADALATADLLHRLIEQATGFGVEHLGELLDLPGRLAPIPKRAEPSILAAS
ncbi:MAG TPA: exonuclease domain-containing protein [Acidimicrobiales bacterium]|nr:exonuclease domain-containing protein [Acidimicrobiales bacterium]